MPENGHVAADPQDAESIGLDLLARGEPHLAFPHLVKALESEPMVGRHWIAVNKALVASKLFDAANALIGQVRQIGLDEEIAAQMRRHLLESAGAQLVTTNAPAAPAPAELIPIFATGRAPVFFERARKAVAKGHWIEAKRSLVSVLKEEPNHPRALIELATISGHLGQLRADIETLRAGLKAYPDIPELQLALGKLLRADGQGEQAEAAFRRAAELGPDLAEAHFMLGEVRQAAVDDVGAEAAYRRALEADPRDYKALVQLGAVLRTQKRSAEAEAALLRAIEISPDNPMAHFRLAGLYGESGMQTDLEDWLQNALKDTPGSAFLWSTLSVLRHGNGLTKPAFEAVDKAISISPNTGFFHSNRMFFLLHDADRSQAEIFRAHADFGARLERNTAAQKHRPDPRAATRMPRLGFVSGDLSSHVVAVWSLPLWEKLRERGYEIFAYSNSATVDHMTDKLKATATAWRQIETKTDPEAAAMIRQDKIDILIDLSNHTANNRLHLFAMKPAPVQASYIGLPSTTGMRRMDYYMICEMSVPEGMCDEQYTEKLVRLPRAFMFRFEDQLPELTSLPAFAAGCVTFGSFNRLSKTGQHVVDAWARVLNAVQGSRFLMGGMKNNMMKQVVIDRFAAAGIDQSRLVFRPHDKDYLHFHNEVDILLDTFPYAGGSTTAAALSMGVPVVTLAGNSFASRGGVSILKHVGGLDQFIAADQDDFVRIATDWAGRLPELEAIRPVIRQRTIVAMQQSGASGAAFDIALRQMWARHCQGRPPVAITVSEDAVPDTAGAVA